MTTIHSVSRALTVAVVMAFAIGSLSSRVDAQAKTNNANGTKLAGQSAERRNDAEHRNDDRGQKTSQQTPLAGTVGPTGPMGPAGPTGATGATGARGAAGADGAQGVAGAVGPVGPHGSQGPQGPMGMQGFQGPSGATGAPGTDGATGPAGPAGPQGAKGATGAAGADGAVGPAGPQGPQGATGAAGAAGADGVDGAPGLDGAVGPTGAQGPQGVEGPQGPQGEYVQAEQTLAFGVGTFTHYADPAWVLESLSNGATLQLRRTAAASAPNPPNQPPVNYMVFGIMHPQGCTGNTSINTANGGMKQVFRYADDPPDTLSATLCLEGSFALVSVQDQEKRTELRCTRISPSAVVCQKEN